jgi:periplasmic divalent cation tolerance protein
MDYIAVFITAPDEEEAAKIAKALVDEKLAACANIIKGVRSIYRWEDKVEDEAEVFMVVKTRRALFGSLAARVKQLHSYSVPEVIALPVVEGSADYLDWIGDSTASG